MPDFYNDINIPSPEQQQGGISFDNNINPLVALYQPIQINKKPVGDWYSSSINNTLNSSDFKSTSYTAPFIKTPVKNVEFFDDKINELGYNPTNPNEEQRYGDNQNAIEKLGRRLYKFGTTFIGNVPIMLNDLFSSTKSSLNDPSVKFIQDWMEKQDIQNPNYQNTYQKENPIKSWINPLEFGAFIDNWGNVAQQAAFTAAAFTAAALVDIPLTMLGGEVIESVILPRQIARISEGLAKFGKVIANESEYNAFLKTLDKSDDLYKSVVAGIENIGTSKKIMSVTKDLAGDAFAASGEATMESLMNQREVEKKLLSKYVDEYGNYNGGDELRNKIRQTSIQSGKDVYAPNFAFLLASNMIGYGAFTKPSQLAARASERILGKSLRVELDPNNINKFILSQEKNKMKNLLNTGVKYLGLNNLKETAEEGYQDIISNATKNFYVNNFSKEGLKDTYSFGQSVGDATSHLFSSREGFDTMLMGYLGGVFQGGFRRAIGYKKPNAKTYGNQIVDDLNSTPITSIFNMEEAVTNMSLLSDLEKANNKGDIFEAQNIKFTQFFNTIVSATKANKFEARMIQLDSYRNLDDHNFQFMWGAEKNEKNQEIVNKYFDGLKEKAENIKDNIEKVNNAFGENPFNSSKNQNDYKSFEAYKKELAYSLSQTQNFRNRVDSVRKSIYDNLPVGDLEKVSALSTEQGVSKTVNEFNKEISELKNSEELAKGNEELIKGYREKREFLEDKVKELTKTYNEFSENAQSEMPEHYIDTLESLYNYYGNLNSVNGEFKIDPLQTLSIYNNSQDIYKLIDSVKASGENYKKLAKKEGYSEFAKQYQEHLFKFANSVSKEIEFDKEGKMYFKEDTPEVEDVSTEEDNSSVIDEMNNKVAMAELADSLEKINNKDKEHIAQILDPNYLNDPESEAAKIVSGEIELTDEHIEIAKDRVIAEQEEKSAKLQEKRKTQVIKSSRLDTSTEINEDISFDDQLNAIIDENIAARKTTPSNVEVAEPTAPQQNETEIVESPVAQRISFWKKFKGDIRYLMEKVLSKGVEKKTIVDKLNNIKAQIKILELNKSATSQSQINKLKDEMKIILNEANIKEGVYDHFQKLKEVLFSTNSISEVKSKIYSQLSLTVKKSELQKEKYVPKFYPVPIPGSDKKFPNIFRVSNPYDIALMVGNKEVGILSSPLMFKRGEEYLPLSEMTKEEYVKNMRNPLETYDRFMEEYKAYAKAYNSISDEEGEVVFTEDLQNMFVPHITYGGLNYENSSTNSTLIKDLEYNNPKSVVVSYKLEYDEATQSMKKATTPNILNGEKLSETERQEILEFLDKSESKSKIAQLDKRYFYIMRFPDGSLNKLSIVAANPANESIDNLDTFVASIKEAVLGQDETKLKQINQDLKTDLYIAHRKQKGSNRTYINFEVKNNPTTGENNLSLRIYNAKVHKGATILFTNEEIQDLQETSDLIQLINDKIEDKKLELATSKEGNSYHTTESTFVRELFPTENSISIKNFKKFVKDDYFENSPESKLTVALPKQPFKGMAINLLPKLGVEETVKETPTVTEVVQTPQGATFEVTKTKQGDTVGITKKESTPKKEEQTTPKIETQPIAIEQKIITEQPLTQEEVKEVKKNTKKIVENIQPINEVKGSIIDKNFVSIINQLSDKLIIKKDC